MYHETGTLRTQDDLKLFTQTWGADKARARVVMVHGYAEHSGRYEALARQLAARGLAVHAFDLRGHGQSEGERVYVERFSDYTADLHAFMERVKDQAPKHHFFLLGHSMGAIIAASYVLEHAEAVHGLVLSAICCRTGEEVSPLTKATARMLGRVTPKLPLKKLDAKVLARDESVIEHYDTDPLNYRGKMPARLASEILDAGAEVERRAGDLLLPLLVMHGSSDRLIAPASSTSMFERASSSDKTLKLYQGAYHEIFNDYGKEKVLEDLSHWLEERL